MEITLEEAFAGKTAQIRVPTSVTCETCTGTGAKAGTSPPTCPTCGGHGKVRAQPGLLHHRAHLPHLPGPRRDHQRSLRRPARGAGRVIKERTLSVNIPAGVEDGTRIRLAGEGEAGLRGGPAGDLYIFLSIKPHEFFQRDGADLFCRVPIAMTTAALGGADRGADHRRRPDAREGPRRHPDRQAVPPARARACRCCAPKVTATCTSRSRSRRRRTSRAASANCSTSSSARATRRPRPHSTGFFSKMKEFFEGKAELTQATRSNAQRSADATATLSPASMHNLATFAAMLHGKSVSHSGGSMDTAGMLHRPAPTAIRFAVFGCVIAILTAWTTGAVAGPIAWDKSRRLRRVPRYEIQKNGCRLRQSSSSTKIRWPPAWTMQPSPLGP